MYEKVKAGINDLFIDSFDELIGIYDTKNNIFYMRNAYKKKHPSMYRYLKNIQGYNIEMFRGNFNQLRFLDEWLF